ncbi:MAG: ABC transporter permease [Sphingomonas sp.]|nr:ABC transporter permease [Sphingomonas sp.]
MPSNDRSSTGLLLRDSEWTVMRRVIGALLLRELLTRYGRNNIGFLWLFVEPMLFVGVMVALRLALKQQGFSLNIPIVAFALTGWTSMLLWRNMASRCIGAHRANLALLHHKPVTIFDVYISRVILEFLAYTTAFVALSIGSYAMGWVPAPEDVLQVFWGWLLFGWFGIGLAWTIGGLSEKSDIVEPLWRPISFILMICSGVFFLADTLPPYVREILLWLPMLNMLEYLREGWFGSLFRAHYDLFYVVSVNLLLTFSGLSLVRQVGTDLAEE